MTPNPPPPGTLAAVACVLEASARKPGNVHRFADFDDATYVDFMLSENKRWAKTNGALAAS